MASSLPASGSPVHLPPLVPSAASAVRTVTLQHAARAAQTLEAGDQESFRSLPAQGAEAVVAEADGTMICTVEPGRTRAARRPRQWKEMRLWAAQAQGRVQTSSAAPSTPLRAPGLSGAWPRPGGAGATGRAPPAGDSRAASTSWPTAPSGSPCKAAKSSARRPACSRTFTPSTGSGPLTARQRIPRRRRSRLPTGRPATLAALRQAQGLRHTQQKRLKRGALAAVLVALGEHLEPEKVPDEAAPVRAAQRYLGNRREALDYPDALARERPIGPFGRLRAFGSGLIESGHKHVLHARLKGAGTAWLPAHADALAQLRVLRANQPWDAFWPATEPIPTLHHN